MTYAPFNDDGTCRPEQILPRAVPNVQEPGGAVHDGYIFFYRLETIETAKVDKVPLNAKDKEQFRQAMIAGVSGATLAQRYSNSATVYTGVIEHRLFE